ncbi:branched-chain amino acid ABC transporter ATP-binding protein [Comamonas thiooxydans]|uniref:Branched-chain amino acid ABC transporter ATP-binding protein n=1 Tax=Comamonas thiooxydans TaxID=363952 RepID=A0A0E3BNI4_9BURK|nr:ABC transporter ATP-binding protein [Comamonas thiooxydans]KGH04283.1 branched-chain amino acid ABC transporter ATP-binding protein [Comamonas thiooxydans]KGH28300.1 branched-chain amino acid ABC transporter ATP-binding protein [Comamonas thiooxydans]
MKHAFSTKDECILQATSLHKYFGGARVINGIDMTIRLGEIRCVIGPNGAGKSTFFKLLTGEHVPTMGEVVFMGKRLGQMMPHERIRQGMGIKFQIPGVFAELSVWDHLTLTRSLRKGATSAESEYQLETFQLKKERDVLAGNLSHGKKQWLEIAMAVSLRPALLMLDEPVAGLSSEETYLTGQLILQLQAAGQTIMVVEHDMTFVRQIATQVTVLHGGRVFADGPAEAVLEREDVADIYLGKAS